MRIPFPRLLTVLAAALLLAAQASPASAFCGFYVAKADADLFNRASKVVIAREDRRTVVTMANDYEGNPDAFAMVIPTPYVLERKAIRVEEAAKIDALDSYSAPRLAEYFDPDPCARPSAYPENGIAPPPPVFLAAPAPMQADADFGVTVEARYEVEEYDVLILSAAESTGLQRWLDREGYRIPPEARDSLGRYIAMGMKFFVARIDLSRSAAAAEPDWNGYLRPLQISFESDELMLPIRLGMVNADGPQDLLIYFLTPEGRVEATNYPTVKIPTDEEVPPTVEARFDDFYRALFDRQHALHGGRAVFTEYSWPIQDRCDPCIAGLPSRGDLIELGAAWLATDYAVSKEGVLSYVPSTGLVVGPAHLTWLRLRYTAETRPEDLMFRITGDTDRFQGRYVMRHPFEGPVNCPAGYDCLTTQNARFAEEARTMAALTRWDVGEIRGAMRADGYVAPTVSPTGSYSFDSLADWATWVSRGKRER